MRYYLWLLCMIFNLADSAFLSSLCEYDKNDEDSRPNTLNDVFFPEI